MKRCASAVVDYDSSSDDEIPAETPPPKKRKLPALSTNLVVPTPIDNPALHQGRIRTTPHVDGNWAAHVYVSISITTSHALYSLLDAVIAEARQSVPTLHSFISSQSGRKHHAELHISLSRPIFIRAYQTEELRRAVRKLAQHPPFTLSFTSFAELQNDEHTRTFLVMEIGAGHHELKKLCGDLEPLLESLRQRGFYTSPRFHASIAWALLDRRTEAKSDSAVREASPSPTVSSDPDGVNSTNFSEPQIPVEFVTIPGLPEGLIAKVNHQFGDRLSSPAVGSFDVENIAVRIGKETTSWPFSGN